MKENKINRTIHGPRFLLITRILFVILFTMLTFKWATTIEFIQEKDYNIYAFFGFLIAVTLVLIESQIQDAFPQELLVGLFGLLCGLSASALIQAGMPENLTPPMTRMMLHLFLGYYGIIVALRYAHRLDFSSTKFLTRSTDRLYGAKFLDTSILIDGRIIEIVEAGFLEGLIIIPSFVINELQTLSDSEDHMKRSKGRRGLDISKRLQMIPGLDIEILEDDFPNLHGVDKKLLALSKKYEGTLITTDFNLAKVAEIEETRVLNINQLAQSLKMVLLPGEEIQVQLIREGKEPNQGVAYLDDGTMVVVDYGRKLLGKHVEVQVSSVLQTSAGRMVFAKLKEPENGSKSSAKLEYNPAGSHLLE